MASLFAKYKKEREGTIVIETSKGFVTALELENHFYIEDIYILPEFRRAKEATKLTDRMVEKAKKLGYKKLLGSVDIKANNCTESLKAVLSYGFKLYSIDGNTIYFEREI